MSEEKWPAEQAYLLRCWQTDAIGTGAKWRYSLKEVRGERRLRGFASLQELFDFLAAQLCETGDDNARW